MRLQASLVRLGVGLVAVAVVGLGCSGTALAASTCSANAGTLTLSPGLTVTPATQTVKVKGTMSGCTGGPFATVSYSATLTTVAPASCSLLPSAWDTAEGPAKFRWTPKVKASTGTLSLLMTEKPEAGFPGEVTGGSYAPMTFFGSVSESYTGAATCTTKKVRKGSFSGGAVSFS